MTDKIHKQGDDGAKTDKPDARSDDVSAQHKPGDDPNQKVGEKQPEARASHHKPGSSTPVQDDPALKSDAAVGPAPTVPSNRPDAPLGHGVMPPKTSGAGVQPDKHILDEATGLTKTGSDHPGPGPRPEPLAPGEKPTLDNYSAESGAVASGNNIKGHGDKANRID